MECILCFCSSRDIFFILLIERQKYKWIISYSGMVIYYYEQ